MTPHAWHRRGRLVRVGKNKLFVVDTGSPTDDAPVVVLLHGFPTSSFDWHAVLPSLQRSCRCVALDFLGFGYSDKPHPHTYSIGEQADIVEAVADRLGIHTFHVMAHDYGDTVAQELLARDFDRVDDRRVRSACLLNGGLFPETQRPRWMQRVLASPLGPHAARWLGRAGFDRSLSSVFGDDTRPSHAALGDHWLTIGANRGSRVIPSLLTYLEERATHRDRWLLALIQSYSPLMLINGSRDPVSGSHMVQRYRQLVDHGDVVELPDIGHYPQLEAPDRVSRAYHAWMRRLTAAPRTWGWDTLITGAMVFDGRGSPPAVQDVALRDGRVAARGTGLDRTHAHEVVDAGGYWLLPGFVDLGSQLGVAPCPRVLRHAVRHGATTVAATPRSWCGPRGSWSRLESRHAMAHRVPMVPLTSMVDAACDGAIRTAAQRARLVDEVQRALRRGYAGVYVDRPLPRADLRALRLTVARFGRVFVAGHELESHEPVSGLRDLRHALLQPDREATAAHVVHQLTGARARRLCIDRGTLDLDAAADLVLLDPRALLRSLAADPVRDVWRSGRRVVRSATLVGPDAGPGELLAAR